MGEALLLQVLLAPWACASVRSAYVDPGAGGIAPQLLLGGLTSAALLLRVFWGRFRRRLGSGDAHRTGRARGN